MKSYSLILASKSPRRRELIGKIKGMTVEFAEPDADEIFEKSEKIENIVMKLAEIKAVNVFEKRGGLVLGADTLVSVRGLILGKPVSDKQAEEFFKMLCGTTHEVTTGICFMSESKKITRFEKTYVTFNAFNSELVYNYIKTGKPFDKVGGYGIQDSELKPLIKQIDGDITNVIGLPLALTKETLKENF